MRIKYRHEVHCPVCVTAHKRNAQYCVSLMRAASGAEELDGFRFMGACAGKQPPANLREDSRPAKLSVTTDQGEEPPKRSSDRSAPAPSVEKEQGLHTGVEAPKTFDQTCLDGAKLVAKHAPYLPDPARTFGGPDCLQAGIVALRRGIDMRVAPEDADDSARLLDSLCLLLNASKEVRSPHHDIPSLTPVNHLH